MNRRKLCKRLGRHGVVIAAVLLGSWISAHAAPGAGVVGAGRIVQLPITDVAVLGRAAITPDGRRAVVAGWDGQLALVDLATARGLWRVRAHRGAIRALAVGGTTVVTGGADGAVHRFRLSDGQRLATLRKKGASIRGVAAYGDLAVAVAPDGPGPWLYDGAEGKRRRFGREASRARAVAFSPDGELLAVGGEDGKVRLYRRRDGGLQQSWVAHKQWINAIAFAPDGKRLATSGFDKRTRIWSLAGKRLHSFRGHVRRCVDLAFDHQGHRLASASLDRTVVVWDTTKGRLLRRVGGHRYQVNSVTFAPADAFMLTASTDGYLRLFPAGIAEPAAIRHMGRPGPGELIFRGATSGERNVVRVLDGQGKVRKAALRRLAHILRSGPDDAELLPDAKLVRFLYQVAEHFGRQHEVQIISGYRSPRFNSLRTRQSRQVAKRSKHMLGKAIDFRIQGVPITTLRRYVQAQRFGGVGYYPDSQFIHIDSGKVRRWGGT